MEEIIMYNIEKLGKMGYLSITEVERLTKNKETWYSDIINNSKELVKELGWNKDNLYYYIVSVFEYVSTIYYDGTFIYSIPPLITVDQISDNIERFSHLKEMYYQMYAEGEYSTIICLTDNKYKALVFNALYEKMDKDQRLREFLGIHKICKNSLSAIPFKRIIDLLEYGSKSLLGKRVKSKLADDQGYITVYRGFEKVDKKTLSAIPWSTSIESVLKYSDKFGSEDFVLTGKVHISNVGFIYDEEYSDFVLREEYEEEDGDYDSYIDYKDWENELLVIPNSVTDIRKLDRVKVES